jgi:hypothetical protein
VYRCRESATQRQPPQIVKIGNRAEGRPIAGRMSQPSVCADRPIHATSLGLSIPQLAGPGAGAAPSVPAAAGAALGGPAAAAPRATHDAAAAAVERYVVATFEGYRRALLAQVPALAEPRVADPERALRRLPLLVETLAGFAMGKVIGAVAAAVRYGFGDEVRDGVGRVLGQIARGGAPRAAVTESLAPVPFLRDPAGPLLDALGSRLHARLCTDVAEARAHLARIHAEVERAVPARLGALADQLDRLATDDASAFAFAEQLAAGWRCYVAAVNGERAADATGMWKAWTSRLAGPGPAPEPASAQIVAQGYLMRIG